MPPPSMYDEEIGLAIVDRIANGESLMKICKSPDMPSRTSIYKWLRQHEAFAALMAQARLDQADSLADDILAIADNPRIEADHKRLMVDARKWIASHFNGVKYGERLGVEHSGGVTVVLPEPGDDKL